MKANELMLGDLIIFNCFDKSQVVVQVTEIRNYTIYAKSEIGNHWANPEDIEPIPLTPEILEKNGFKIEIAEYTPNWERCILNPNFFLEDRLKCCYHFNGNNLAKIQYVHELQHALKLCGIDKEIVL